MILKLFGVLILFGCLLIVFLFDTSSTFSGGLRIFHWPAILLTGLGPIGIVFLSSDLDRIREMLKILVSHSPAAIDSLNSKDAKEMHHLTRQFYSQGARALDKAGNGSTTLARVIDRISLRIPIQDIRILVNRERQRSETKIGRAMRVASLGQRMAPSVGMLGTILGMVQLLSHLKDPSNIGTYMSLALLTTFYGLFFSLVLWTPLQNRLESVSDAKERTYDQVLEWLQLLEDRKPIQYFEDSMKDHGISIEQRAPAAAPAAARR